MKESIRRLDHPRSELDLALDLMSDSSCVESPSFRLCSLGGSVPREVPHLRNGLEMVSGALAAGRHGHRRALPALRRHSERVEGLQGLGWLGKVEICHENGLLKGFSMVFKGLLKGFP